MGPTRLIELADGVLVEATVEPNRAQPISGGLAERVNTGFDKIQPVLIKICQPLMSVWQELNREVHVQQVEIELGLSFEGEGNLFITKAKTTANLGVKLVIKSKE